MLKVLVLLQIAALSKYDDLRASRRSERGSVTMEHVLWAVAVIGIVGIVVLGGHELCHLRSGQDQVAAAGDAASGARSRSSSSYCCPHSSRSCSWACRPPSTTTRRRSRSRPRSRAPEPPAPSRAGSPTASAPPTTSSTKPAETTY